MGEMTDVNFDRKNALKSGKNMREKVIKKMGKNRSKNESKRGQRN